MIKKITLLLTLNYLLVSIIYAQIDSSLLKRETTDTSKQSMNMDAIYNRPFLSNDKVPLCIGGYVEVNWSWRGGAGHGSSDRGRDLYVGSFAAFAGCGDAERGGGAVYCRDYPRHVGRAAHLWQNECRCGVWCRCRAWNPLTDELIQGHIVLDVTRNNCPVSLRHRPHVPT